MSGLVINGMHVLDMTMNGDPRVKVYGDVRNVRGIVTSGRDLHPPRSNVHPPQRGKGKSRGGNNQAEYVYSTGDFQRVSLYSYLGVNS